MKHFIAASLIALMSLPAAAQMADPPTESPADESPGRDLIEEGAKLLFRGLLNEAEPALRDLERFADEIGPAMRMLREEMGPALADIIARIDDIKNYESPEIMPNGDIIIRRAPDAPDYVAPPSDDIEL